MGLKQLLTTNLEDTKLGKGAFVVFAIIILVAVISNYFSVESRCRREVEKTARLYTQITGSSPSSGALRQATEMQIRDCVNSAKQK